MSVSVDRYAVNFVPRESGLHYVHVKLNGVHVPGSPYPVQVGRLDADASQVRAYGDGLYKGFTGTTCQLSAVSCLCVCVSVCRSVGLVTSHNAATCRRALRHVVVRCDMSSCAETRRRALRHVVVR